MVAVGRRPSADLFVVSVGADQREAAARRLAALGQVTELSGNSGLLLLRVGRKAANPKSAWRRAAELLGKAGRAMPVLLDEAGQPLYPTGEVTVRFKRALSDKELRDFARAHGLSFARRNEFVREQAVFQPAKPEEKYLPDLIKEVAQSEETKQAWANTLAQYTRY